METFEEIQPQQISLGPTVILQNLNTLISTQELGEIARQYPSLVVQEDYGGDQWEELNRLRTLINRDPPSIFIAPSHLSILGVTDDAEHITIVSFHSYVIIHVKFSDMMAMNIQYTDYLAQTYKLELLIHQMLA